MIVSFRWKFHQWRDHVVNSSNAKVLSFFIWLHFSLQQESLPMTVLVGWNALPGFVTWDGNVMKKNQRVTSLWAAQNRLCCHFGKFISAHSDINNSGIISALFKALFAKNISIAQYHVNTINSRCNIYICIYIYIWYIFYKSLCNTFAPYLVYDFELLSKTSSFLHTCIWVKRPFLYCALTFNSRVMWLKCGKYISIYILAKYGVM